MSIEQLNLALDIAGLTPGQKLVLLILANRANDACEAWPSIDNIVRQSCMSRSGVKNTLAALTDAGLLLKESRRNRTNIYRLRLETETAKGSLSSPYDAEGHGHSVTDVGQSLTPKRLVSDPVVVTQNPQTQRNPQITTIEPTEAKPQNLNAEAWQEYVEYRKEAKLPTLKAVSERKQTSRMAYFSMAVQAEAVEQTIANGWKGLFPEKVEQQAKKSAGSDPFYDSVRKNIALVT
jgi:hypothetical protein